MRFNRLSFLRWNLFSQRPEHRMQYPRMPPNLGHGGTPDVDSSSTPKVRPVLTTSLARCKLRTREIVHGTGKLEIDLVTRSGERRHTLYRVIKSLSVSTTKVRF